jgi:hypothetical protein
MSTKLLRCLSGEEVILAGPFVRDASARSIAGQTHAHDEGCGVHGGEKKDDERAEQPKQKQIVRPESPQPASTANLVETLKLALLHFPGPVQFR